MTLSFTTHWRDELPDFYTSLSPTPLDNARLIWRNAPLAQQLGVPDALFAPESGVGVWGGEALLPGMSPLAQVYSGHQFGALGRPAGRRTRDPARRAAAGGWPPLRLASERRRPDSLFADGGRPRRAALDDPGKSGVGGDACSGDPDDARPRRW